MATTATLPALPDTLIIELERVAKEQQRSVDQVLADAVDLYLKQEQARRLAPAGRARTDVQRIMEEFRRERA